MGNSSTVTTGSIAPDFTLPSAAGGEITLSSYRGRPVVLVFLRGFA
jgi:peroxiredoxin Q/BCP